MDFGYSDTGFYFPSNIFSSIRKWFDENAWHIRYQMTSSQILEFLLSRGIKHIVALEYAHKPGIAKQLNKYMAGKCREYNHRVTGMATVFPGENDAENILQNAFDSGLNPPGRFPSFTACHVPSTTCFRRHITYRRGFITILNRLCSMPLTVVVKTRQGLF